MRSLTIVNYLKYIIREYERWINIFNINLMEGEKMVKKSKVGSTGRFGARYGRKAKEP